MPKYGLIACFIPVIKVDWVNISSKGTGSQKLGVGKWKKIRVLAIQKVAKTGNIGKNSSGGQYQLCKIPQHAELSLTMREMTRFGLFPHPYTLRVNSKEY